MANLLGIDIGYDTVRVALLRTSYRRVAIDMLQECRVADFPSTADAIRAATNGIKLRSDSVAVNLSGDRIFARRVELPPTAAKQLHEVLPFELEAQLPFDLEEGVYDSRVAPRTGAQAPLDVFAVVARIEHVRALVELVQAAIHSEPERVEPSPFALANLAAVVDELEKPGPYMVVHLDSATTDVAVIRAGQVEMARTITGGTEGLPASAKPLARDLRQTLLAWQKTGGAPPVAIYLVGPGAQVSGAEAYLSAQLGLPIGALPMPQMEGLTPERLPEVTRFARAIGLALALGNRPRGMNLRQGPLAYERGFGFLQDKIPLLAGIGSLIVVSFCFSAWMEMRALDRQTEVLKEALAAVTLDVLGESIRDPKMAEDAVSVTPSKMDDPMPRMDGFDIMVEISKAVPPDVTHDIEELDFQKGHATIHGIVPTIPDAQQIANAMQTNDCFKSVKIVRTTKVVNEDRQKYVLEFDVKCPLPGEETKADKTEKGDKTSESGGETESDSTGNGGEEE